MKNKDFYIGGIINEVEHLFTKNGNGYSCQVVSPFDDKKFQYDITSKGLTDQS